MNKKILVLLGIIVILILARVLAMYSLPLTDTTEARYGHTAYLMATTNDFITPYFDKNVPFWGKPPFAFWMQAISYKIFGMNDFSARFPSMVFTIFSMMLIFKYLKTFYSVITAFWGMIIYLSFLVVYILSGVIITDPYLAFATTLTMISFLMVIKNHHSYWKYLFFIGLGIGLLSKGPLSIVLVGGALFFWIIFDFKNRFNELKKFPWKRGIILTLIISLPWYIIADIKTPGFLNYFIIGEHFKRFLIGGWSGDLYGTAHKKPYGQIWVFWLFGAFPWILIAIYVFIKNIKNSFKILKDNSEIAYLVSWSLFSMIFFSAAGNILATYVLPALASLAILLAIYLEKIDFRMNIKKYNLILLFALVIPILSLIANLYLILNPGTLKTQKYMISYYKKVKQKDEPIYFLNQRTFSSEYYGLDSAILVSNYEYETRSKSNYINYEEFKEHLKNRKSKIFLAIRKGEEEIAKSKFNLDLKEVFSDRKYTLFEL